MATVAATDSLPSNEYIVEARQLVHLAQSTLSDNNQSIQATLINSLSELIESLSNCNRDANFINETRQLDHLIAATRQIQKKEKVEKDWEELINLVSFMVWNFVTVSKVNRKLLQLIHELEKSFPGCVSRCLTKYQMKLVPSSDVTLFTLWSGLVCQTRAGQHLVISHLSAVLEVLAGQLVLYVDEPTWTVYKQQHLQSVVKLLLDLLQHIREVIVVSLQQANPDSVLSNHWKTIIRCLSKLLQLQSVPKDCSLLAGTAMAQLIILTCNHERPIIELYNLYNSICTGGVVKTTLGDLVLYPVERKGLTFGHVSLLNGISAVSDVKMLTELLPDKDHSHGFQIITPSLASEPGSCQKNEDVTIKQNLDLDDEKEEIVLSWLHTQLCQSTSLLGSQYQTFRLLAQFYTKLSKLFNVICHYTNIRMFSHHGPLLNEIMNLIWTHLDSPVDGVAGCVLDLFRMCLTLAKQETRLHHSVKEPNSNKEMLDEFQYLINELLDMLLKMSWQVRGRHNLLSILLAFTDIKLVLKSRPEIISDAFLCLATNYLTPATTHLYTSIVNIFSKMSDGLEVWKKTCLMELLASLSSSNHLVRLNSSQHLLPITFKRLPQSLTLVKDDLEQRLQERNCSSSSLQCDDSERRKNLLHGFLAVLKTARNCQLLKDWPVAILQETLVHPDNNIRLETFCLICTSPKTSEPLRSTEVALLCSSLPDNMNIDEPPFRQQLQACIRQTVTRSRNTAVAELKSIKAKQQSESLHAALGYIQWLWDLCLHHLHPGANYQRLKTCLDWITVILDSLTIQPDRRKGGHPEQTPALLEYAKNHDMLSLYTPQSCLALLSCILHDADEIKQQALFLLVRYFPQPLPFSLVDETSFMEVETKLLQQALNLCNSLRARETESGATLCQLMFEKYVLAEGCHFSIVNSNDNSLCVQFVEHIDEEGEAVTFMHQILDILEQSLRCSQSNVLRSARTMPSHGLVLVCHRCLSVCKGKIKDSNKWQPICQQLQTIATKLIDQVLEVLGADLGSEENAPSFEQMGLSIQNIISSQERDMLLDSKQTQSEEPVIIDDYDDDDNDRNNTVLSSEHQTIMSWCWLNIKECSLLLSCLVETFPSGPSATQNTVMTCADVQAVADTLVKVLTKCRHRGAIEGCNQGFLHLCVTLLSSPVKELFDIPGKLLDKVLNRLRHLSRSSITRRSAGLPLIVQSILASEAKTKQSNLLKRAITSLVSVIEEPTPSNYNEQEDLPQVHALNIMKAIFREKSLSQSVMEHVAKVFVLAIDLLSSPLWAIRNSAIQLYGALQCRMLGQKKTGQDHLHTTTAAEFFAQFPDLHPYMMTKVKDASLDLSQGQLRLHPSLFPVLSILAKLSPGQFNSGLQSSLDQFLDPVARLAGSPLFSVRTLGAEALTAVIPQERAAQYITKLVEQLPRCRDESPGFNRLHGILLQLKTLVTVHRGCQDDRVLMQMLCSRWWLLTEENPCFMVRSAFLSVLKLVNVSSHLDLDKQARDLLSIGISGSDGDKVGYSDYCKVIVSWWLSHGSLSLLERVKCCLKQDSIDMRLACLSWLNDHRQDLTRSDNRDVLALVIGSLHVDMPWQEMCGALKLILDIASHFTECHEDTCHPLEHNEAFRNMLMTIIQMRENSQPAALCLAVSALVIKMNITDSSSRLLEWSRLMKLSAGPLNTEAVREHTAQALCLSGIHVIQHCRNQDNKVVFNLLDASIQLLKDEHCSIRNTSAKLIASLSAQVNNTEMKCLHYNTAMRVLLDIIPAILPADLGTLSWLYGHITVSEKLADIIKQTRNRSTAEQFEPSDINPYEEVVVENALFLAAVKKLHMNSELDIDSWIQQEMAPLSRIIQQVSQLITIKDDVLDVTCMKSVFEGLHGLICRITALEFMSSSASDKIVLNDLRQQIKVVYCQPNFHFDGTGHL